MKLLIVDDDQRAALVLERGLKAHGYQVEVAQDGMQGLALEPVAPCLIGGAPPLAAGYGPPPAPAGLDPPGPPRCAWRG